MTIAIPRTQDEVEILERGDRGIAVWALQRSLNKSGAQTSLIVDGVYGHKTQSAFEDYQLANELEPDGRAGPATQSVLSADLQRHTTAKLPERLLSGQVTQESGNYFGATNWSTPGGVDCGLCQRRVLEADFANDQVVRRAFDAPYQLGVLSSGVRTRHDNYVAKAIGNERAWRLAVLGHNYPFAVQELVAGRWPNTYSTSRQQWVVDIYRWQDSGGAWHLVTFPDGAPIQTPLDHCARYSLGDTSHNEPGQMVKLVTNWNA